MEHFVLEDFKRILETMLVELEQPLQRRDRIAIENTPDALDEVQNATEREFAIRQLEQQSGRYRSIKAALGRIEQGTYGECSRCESEITFKRLKAVPWTPYCLNCQAIADQNITEAEAEFVQFTERGPKIVRAGYASAIGQSASPELQESRRAHSDDPFRTDDADGPSAPSPERPQKKPPASERSKPKTKSSVG
jgi:DnaK suppressor protein